MASELSLQKAARAWCVPETGHIAMIPELAIAFANILDDEGNTELIIVRRKGKKLVVDADSDYKFSSANSFELRCKISPIESSKRLAKAKPVKDAK